MKLRFGNRSGVRMGSMALVVVVMSVSEMAGPTQGVCSPPRVVRSSGPHAAATERILRDIRDPHTGEHWILVSDPANPAGPGRLVRSGGGEQIEARAAEKKSPAIRAGDKVILEEHTARADAYLDAVALERAAIGSLLKVRLKIGGRVVRVVAIAAGRVALAP